MSLAADVSVPRPLPPSRSRRPPSFAPSSSHDGLSNVNGVLGGLRERSEEEVRAADRSALEAALTEAWKQHDQLIERLEELEESHLQLENERAGLEASSRLEADLEDRDELLDLLRGRVAEAERLSRESGKRVVEQEKAFEAERQALQTQELHLQQRIRSLMSARPAHAAVSDTRNLDDLQEELASLSVSHSTILAQRNTLAKEVDDLRAIVRVLAEENEGWEFLLRERTLNGKVREGGLLGPREEEERYEREGSQLSVLDEELEMNELHSDLDAQCPILEDDQVFARDLDVRMLSRSPEEEHLAPPRRKKENGGNLGSVPVTGNGLDLAAELGRAEVDLNGSEMRQLGKGNEGEALRAEIKKLREENKALTLYCSKIIDRIIAQEGFEHILSVDYKTRRMGSWSASGAGRGKLKDITNAMQAGAAAPKAASEGPASTAAGVKEEKKARPLSMLSRAMSGSVEKATAPLVDPTLAEAKEARSEKRARRGFSLDFRSLGFGSSSTASTATEPKNDHNASLKPLTLPSRATPVTASAKTGLGRRLEKHEEDEDDRRERHHLEATLKLMGVDRGSTFSDSPPKNGAVPGKKLVRAQLRPMAQGEERESLIQPTQQPMTESSRKGTPLSRLSSALGTSDSPPYPMLPELAPRSDVPPEVAAEAALKAFDQREAEHVKALSKGKAAGGYTSPPPSSLRRGSGSRRVASGGSTRSSSRDAEKDHKPSVIPGTSTDQQGRGGQKV